MSTLSELRNRLATQGLPLNPQEAFNSALEGVRAQGYQKSFDNGACQYRRYSENGSEIRCAIGHCLTGDILDKLEVNRRTMAGISQLCKEYNIIACLFIECELGFLQDIQVAHDSMLNAVGFEQSMEFIAKDWELKYFPLSH